MDNAVSERMLNHLIGKILNHVDDIVQVEHYLTEDAETVIVAYGSTSRSALPSSMRLANGEGRSGF